jgi:two-component system cell cycle response regulator CpdR
MANILLVDDDIALLEFTRASLENANHIVISFTDGLSAYEELQKNTSFDLLLTDIIMPGMDGMELAEKAKSLAPNIKIMFMTGFSGLSADKTEKKQIMSKPFHLKDLLNEVEIALKKED